MPLAYLPMDCLHDIYIYIYQKRNLHHPVFIYAGTRYDEPSCGSLRLAVGIIPGQRALPECMASRPEGVACLVGCVRGGGGPSFTYVQ